MIRAAMKVPLGQVVATPGALHALASNEEGYLPYLFRHGTGDWGEVGKEDCEANDEALLLGARLLSSYRLRDGTKIWIITEADRSSTCILLPEEY
jgi:hypothetical protein